MPKRNKYFELLKKVLEENDKDMKPDSSKFPFEDMFELTTEQLNRRITEAKEHFNSDEFQEFIAPIQVLLNKARLDKELEDSDTTVQQKQYVPLVSSVLGKSKLDLGLVIMARVVEDVPEEYKMLGLTPNRTVALQGINNMKGHYLVHVGGKTQAGITGEIFEVDINSF